MFGLDDLRQWTLNSAIQSHVDVYLSAECFEFVSRVFPYLVDPSKATGGGDVAGLRFHVMPKIDDAQYSLVNIDGIPIQPFEGAIKHESPNF